jgi:hypothetical protein
MMSLWDALRMNMMISYQELVRTFLNSAPERAVFGYISIPEPLFLIVILTVKQFPNAGQRAAL